MGPFFGAWAGGYLVVDLEGFFKRTGRDVLDRSRIYHMGPLSLEDLAGKRGVGLSGIAGDESKFL